jgi:hypothetical protein
MDIAEKFPNSGAKSTPVAGILLLLVLMVLPPEVEHEVVDMDSVEVVLTPIPVDDVVEALVLMPVDVPEVVFRDEMLL